MVSSVVNHNAQPNKSLQVSRDCVSPIRFLFFQVVELARPPELKRWVSFLVNDSSTYYNSDAWVLLAIIYANRSGHGTLDKIIAAGDAINVAIFLPNELEGGLARLTAGGYISEHDGTFAPTDKALAYSRSSRNRRAMLKELKDVQRMLASRSTEPVDGVKYPGFSEAAYDEAIETYRYSIRSGA
jgi:hypothetical protein